MLLTLPLVLFIVMAEVAVGAVSLLVFLDWRKEVTRGFLIAYALIYLAFTGLTYLFQQGFAAPLVLSSYPQLDQAWIGSLSLPLLLFFLLQIPYSLFLILDKQAGTKGKSWSTPASNEEEPAPPQKSSPVLVALRYLSGGATVFVGLLTVLVMAMIFRPLAAANIGGVFTVVGFFAAAFALGGVLTAMWLGHWYLAASTVSEKPLLFSTAIVIIAIVAQVIFAFAAGPGTAYADKPTTTSGAPAVTAPASGTQVKTGDAPAAAPLSSGTIGWLRILVGFVIPLVLGGFIWKLVRDRSFQSATGMLYLIVVCALAGEIMARGLFLGGL